MKKVKLLLSLILLPLALAACSKTPAPQQAREQSQVQQQVTSYVVPAWAIVAYSGTSLQVKSYWQPFYSMPYGTILTADPASSYRFTVKATGFQDLSQYRIPFNVIYVAPL